ncbi:MAG TPA: hypothetical protein ENN80_13765 [Candidatus Hydrogenedentes bacterium]|nr:hypothetical protein [Candidatus Hydrogenedentota bacterium]
MSPEAEAIQTQIARLKPCHEHYVPNVRAIVEMIGCMQPGSIVECGKACSARRQEAAAYLAALVRWRNREGIPGQPQAYARKVYALLGSQTNHKIRLVDHVIAKLRDNTQRLCPEGEEDLDSIESRIQHLDICNHGWRINIQIVLREIGLGRRIAEWHAPNGVSTHGDTPDRIPVLKGLITSLIAWLESDIEGAGKWAQVLGKSNEEKRRLVASLCRRIHEQHAQHDTVTRLPAVPPLQCSRNT